MGILCELFVSSRRNARKFEKRLEDEFSPGYVRIETKGLMALEFAVLWAVLLGEAFDPVRHQLEDLYFGLHYRTRLGRMYQRLLIYTHWN
jgi:hypothetical protein